MNMSKWIGYAVSVNCGSPLGCYQGTILQADGGTITLTKAFRNGFPYPKCQVTLNAADIKELKIIEERGEEEVRPRTQTHSTVALSKNNKKCQRATVCETLQANPSNSASILSGSNKNTSTRSGVQQGPAARPAAQQGPPARSKPIEIQANRSNKNANPTGSYGQGGGSGSTPRGCSGGSRGAAPLHAAARRRNEACFNTDTTDPVFDEEFDFEKNLALFDKQALWEQMRHCPKPDLVRSTDEKFRHDENVLGGGGGGGARTATRAIRVPDEARGPLDYVSDDGVIVPSVCPRVRSQLWEALQRCGLLDAALLLLARAAADVALRLVGGGRRLDPRNAHQVPTVVALVGPHRLGACGLQTVRLLLSHGVRSAALVCGAAGGAVGDEVARALAQYRGGGGAVCERARDLPCPDLVLLADHDPAAPAQDTHCYSEALSWARGARAGVVCIEPRSDEGTAAGGVAARASVVALLPPALSDLSGRLYLADVAPPQRIFSELRMTYKPPFGAASVLALHPNDD